MQMESDKWHKHLYQALDIPCNDNMKENNPFLSFWTVLQELVDKENTDNTKTCWCFYVSHLLCIECNNSGWKIWYFIGVFCSLYLYYEAKTWKCYLLVLKIQLHFLHFNEPAWDKKFGSSWINSGFNSFAIDNLSISLSLSFRPSATYFLFPGAPTTLSIIIKNSKTRHDIG